MKLRDLFNNVVPYHGEIMNFEAMNELATSKLAENPDVVNVCNDSRKVQEGDIFLAISGFDYDGHKFLDKLNNGSIVIVEKYNPSLDTLAQFKVSDSRLAYALLNASLQNNPSKDMKIIGITGSNGKTGCSMMLRQIFTEAERQTGLLGTIIYSSGKQEIESKLTTPDAATLQDLLREMKENGQDSLIMEVSSIGQDQKRDAGIYYDVMSCINISREHIDYHGTFEKYIEAKSNFIRHADKEAFCILNADDRYCMDLVHQTRAKVYTFSIDNPESDLRAINLDLSTAYGCFDFEISDKLAQDFNIDKTKTYHLELKVPGRHTVSNSLAAALMALCSNINIDTICSGLEKYYGVERRFQEIYNAFSPLLPFKVFDDHFANAGNIDVTMKSICEIDYKNLHIVYALRGKRGVTVTRESLETFFKYADKIKLKNFFASLSEDVVGYYNEVSKEEKECFEQMMHEKNLVYSLDHNLEEAIDRVFAVAEEGDLVLLAGCQGMDAGARIFLELANKHYPQIDTKLLFLPVKDRVCGRKGERA